MQENQSHIQYLKHHQIDFEKWDNCISNSCNELIYAHSFFLNIVSPNWDALILNDYEIVMPLTLKSKLGIRYLSQPLFTQQLGLFTNSINSFNQYQNLFLTEIQNHFKFIEIQLNALNKNNNLELRNNFELNLNFNYETLFKNFGHGIKDNLRKAKNHNLIIEECFDFDLLIDFFIAQKGAQFENISIENYDTLKRLCKVLNTQNLIQGRVIKSHNQSIIASGIFIHTSRRIIFINGTTNIEGRKNGALSYILAKHIEEFSNQKLIFDFEGSVNPSLGKFYESFGCYNNPYPKLKINNLPWFLKLFKK